MSIVERGKNSTCADLAENRQALLGSCASRPGKEKPISRDMACNCWWMTPSCVCVCERNGKYVNEEFEEFNWTNDPHFKLGVMRTRM